MKTIMAVVMFMLAPAVCFGQDFCIFNKVYAGKNIAESVTIFKAGRVYDVLTEPAEVTIFDPPGNRFVILDTTRKVKTEVTFDQIEGFCQRVRAEALATNDPLAKFLSEPTFQEAFDDAAGELTLTNDWLVYQVKTALPKHDTMATQFVSYINWQTKLNAVARPGALPPYPRIKLNDALGKLGRLPVEVQVTRYSAPPARKPVTLRSEHRVQAVILASDQVKIDEADRHLATFATVSMLEYQRREQPAAETARAK